MVTVGRGTKLASGVPLGGIGAGKVELNNKGKMVNLTIANNWAQPIPWMRGFHVLVRPDDSAPFFLEYDIPIKRLYGYEPDELTLIGRYPICTIKAKKGDVEATLEAFSPMIPRNLADSTIPAVGIAIRVAGSKSGRVAVAASNIAGYTNIGRINRSVTHGIKFSNPRSNDYDGARGELCLLGADPSEVYTQYNCEQRPGIRITENAHYPPNYWEAEEPWRSMISGAKFEGQIRELTGYSEGASGALITTYEEAKTEEVRLALSWYFTGRSVLYPYGHYYQTRFKDAEEVGRYVLSEFERLRQRSGDWHETMVRRDLPEWLRDAIINSTYILSSSTWLDERGRFAVLEGTKVCTLLGTISGFCYEAAALPIVRMFPELDRTFLKLLANAAREDGYIPHDLGDNSFDHPSDGTTAPPGWKDTGPAFILLVLNHYRHTMDVDFLREMYPAMLRGFDWTVKHDTDGDGLPDLEGEGDGGLDATAVKGRDSYCSSVFIASLIALREISTILGRREDAERLAGLLPLAKRSFSELYNGRYFEAWMGEPTPRGYVYMGQLVGHWWTNILDLDPVTDKQKIDSSFDHLFHVNGQASPYCTPNAVHEETGIIWNRSCQTWSSWPRMVFSFAGARYREGDHKWLDVAKKEWDNLVAHGLVWDQPSRMDGRTGKPDGDQPDPEKYYLDHYIGSPAIWTFNLEGRPASHE